MKQIFIIQGEPMTGKSILGSILDESADAKVYDDFIADSKSYYNSFKKELLNGIGKLYSYIVIITRCNDEDLTILVDRLKEFNKPISICKMSRA